MSRTRVTAIAALLLLLLLPLTPARAADNPGAGATAHPQVGWPITRSAADLGPLTVVLVGRRDLHGLRVIARRLDARVAGLDIRARRGIRCADVPARSMCIRVRIRNYGDSGWAGWAPIQPAATRRTIHLNTFYPYLGHKRSIAGHELMHSLGMRHHLERGLVGMGWPNRPSASEIRALRKAY